jgi:hypothetical protein
LSKSRKSLSDDDFRLKPFPGKTLWRALDATLDIFGSSMKEATISELQKEGLDLQADDKQHTLAEIGEKLSSIFGQDGTEVIVEQIAKKLKSDG